MNKRRYSAAAGLANVVGEMAALVAAGDNARILDAYTELRRKVDAAEKVMFGDTRRYTVHIARTGVPGGYTALRVVTIRGRTGGWLYSEIIGSLVGSVKLWTADYPAGRLALGAHTLSEDTLVRMLLQPNPSLRSLLVEHGIGHVRKLYEYDPKARGLGTTLAEAEAAAETKAVLARLGKGGCA